MLRDTAGLDYTLFRPFNWIEQARLDQHREGRKLAGITQFLGHIVRGEPSSSSTAARRSAPSPTSTTAA
jgi:hypothetical protein